jgi:uncharacterized protein YdhG (YjbR/CyaY superfamily)
MQEKGYQTIDEYIKSCSKDVQTKLKELRSLIKSLVPKASEKISYQMPTFFLNRNLVHFAAHSNHIGFYPTPSGITHFRKELEKYVTSKGAIQFPLEKPLPLGLIK